MKTTVIPSKFKGEINANPSKSIMQRVIAIAALSSGKIKITNRDKSKDSMAALRVVEAIGARVLVKGDSVEIAPGKELKNSIWNVGESGLSARMFAPIAGLFDEDITITGEGSLLTRPMNAVVDALEQLGLEVNHNNYFLPLVIRGKIKKNKLDLDLRSGSQLLTGLLIALVNVETDTEIVVKNLTSKPYIDLTRCVLSSFGSRVENINYEMFKIKGNEKIERELFNVEGDWSGVAFHLVGAAISGNVTINGINAKSKQSDRAILEVLKSVGAIINIDKNRISVKKGELNSFVFDATDAPDLFPPLAVLAAYCDGISKIKGVSRLKHKESDRFKTIKEEFGKIDVKVEQEGDFMVIYGTRPKGGIVHSHNDHRIAMAMATIGLCASGNIEIENSECVSKSYPHYFEDYKVLGGEIGF